MSNFEGFDQTVEQAWSSFEASLATHLRAMRGGDLLGLTPAGSDADALSYLRFLGRGDGSVVCEVPHRSGDDAAPTPAADFDTRLVDLGWHPPADAATDPHFVDLPPAVIDDWASRSVTVLREMWDVPHPGFLTTKTTGRAARLAYVSDGAGDAAAATVWLDPMTAVAPRDVEHLRQLVSTTVEDMTGNPPVADDDGDLVIRIGTRLVFLLPHPQDRILRIWVPLVSRISGRTRTAELISDLNARAPHVKVVLRKDQVNALIDIVAAPFVPEHLRDMLTRITAFLDYFDEHFADSFDGELYGREDADADQPQGAAAVDDDYDSVPTDADTEPLPAALQTLIQLDPEGGTLRAAEVAQICGRDRDLILNLMCVASEQEISWHGAADLARDGGDTDEAAACAHDAEVWANTLESLRGALRLVALPERNTQTGHPPVAGQMELFDELADAGPKDAATGPASPAPEATLFDDPA
ncbi:T3SS (YopN, CesT) and YbjN peptide-binding chaperone 1 [Rhodococcus kronopolitis]|uniref:Uncharacterized protein n=1 Tax=Rhodococcus kronopolitis TaxID=1460226 RepID=A0ABV9FV41_9NOCA